MAWPRQIFQIYPLLSYAYPSKFRSISSTSIPLKMLKYSLYFAIANLLIANNPLLFILQRKSSLFSSNRLLNISFPPQSSTCPRLSFYILFEILKYVLIIFFNSCVLIYVNTFRSLLQYKSPFFESQSSIQVYPHQSPAYPWLSLSIHLKIENPAYIFQVLFSYPRKSFLSSKKNFKLKEI